MCLPRYAFIKIDTYLTLFDRCRSLSFTVTSGSPFLHSVKAIRPDLASFILMSITLSNVVFGRRAAGDCVQPFWGHAVSFLRH